MTTSQQDTIPQKENLGDTHNNVSASYESLHKPSSQFTTRDEYLEHELQIMQPKRWRPNLPFRDYRFEFEDTIPAMAGTIGKVVMVGAIAATFAAPLGLSDAFVLENVRYELLIVALFYYFIFWLYIAYSQIGRYAWPINSTYSDCSCCGWPPNGIWTINRCFWFYPCYQ